MFRGVLVGRRHRQPPVVCLIVSTENAIWGYRGLLSTVLRQHRTKLVRKMRRQIFRQIVQKFRRRAGARQEISVQDDGKYASSCAAKATAANGAVLP